MAVAYLAAIGAMPQVALGLKAKAASKVEFQVELQIECDACGDSSQEHFPSMMIF
ncbi:hypothetical protein [Shewanella amazonensis]|uniref:hypothetical protein n=1 Tax=Shewanella amazonensis TaxID=60478 RepID=UPI0002D8F306